MEWVTRARDELGQARAGRREVAARQAALAEEMADHDLGPTLEDRDAGYEPDDAVPRFTPEELARMTDPREPGGVWAGRPDDALYSARELAAATDADREAGQ
jgi:hypothetical protein